ncbi:major facilitator superfamily domain-containing protein [Clohesyomyces aquaticus]|uniref:Major facilitator superfamily domain-containing protein n=1 Tax=Clohesyomyces aquaticus TaxID=1231657 RepID=A0A1Y1YBY8_9PLEO|nr:major facilitator superfamily domain-containing protein [Clohesyomyces aquaticus]
MASRRENPRRLTTPRLQIKLALSSRPSTAETVVSVKSTDSENTVVHKDVLRLYREASLPSILGGKKSFDDSNTVPSGATFGEIPLSDRSRYSDIVSWTGDSDPDNPMNWSGGKKALNLGVIILTCFASPFASSVFAPALSDMMTEFKETDQYLAGFVISIYVLGYAIGPLVVAPLSEQFGRAICYHVCILIFFTFTMACAFAKNLRSLAVLRFLSGCGGSVVFALAPSSVTDMVRPPRRGAFVALIGMGYNLGPAISPMVGSHINAAFGWRWVFRTTGFLGILCFVLSVLFLSETYEPVLLERRARRMRKSTGNQNLRSKFASVLPPGKHFVNVMLRPLKLLLFSPNIFLVSFITAVGYGYMYMLYTTFPSVFVLTYHWKPQNIGLAYLGTAVGNLLAMVIGGVVGDLWVKERAIRGDMKPENRLLPMIIAWPLVPVGLLVYGWTRRENTHWMWPLVGTAIFGMGSMSAILFSSTYIVEAYETHSASATAASSVLRSLVGGLVPLFAFKLYNKKDFGLANSLLAGIALVLCPVPFVFYRYGERLRKRFKMDL